MKCPIDETLMIDYLESCCEAELAEQVRLHLEQCPDCSREYNELAAVRKMLAGTAPEPADQPPESFWAESARAVAEATYLQPEKLERRWSLRFPRAGMAGALAAAAVLVMALTWLFEFGPPQTGPENGQSLAGREEAVLSEEALQDSLWLLWQEMQEFEMAANTLESIYALGAETDNGTAGVEYLATDQSFYDGLQDLNEEQLLQVEFMIAGL
ncbi:anti-sigma factor family protein [Gemmatimonadota bacterium]